MSNYFEGHEIERVEVHDIGDQVLCDACGEDYTESDAVGGFLFCNWGVCPACAPKFEEDARKYNEEHFITRRAGEDETFKQFVLRMRGGDNRIITTVYK